MGQHTSNTWKNLRTYICNLPDDYIVCAIKIKQLPSSYRSSFASNNLNSSVSQLIALDDSLFNSKPSTMKEENEKWSKINSIKEELISRVQSRNDIGAYKTPITKEALIEFIDNRIENNNNVINSIIYNVDESSISKENNLLVRKCKNGRSHGKAARGAAAVLWRELYPSGAVSLVVGDAE